MPPRTSLIPLPHLLSILFLPPTILLFWNIALITTLLSSFVLLFRVLGVYFDVGIAILSEQWRRSPPSQGVKEGWRNNESISRLERRRKRRRSRGGLREEEEKSMEVEDLVLPIGRVNYATLIRPLEPVSEWRVRRGGGGAGASSGYLDLDLDLEEEELEGWSRNRWEGVASR